MEPLPPAAQKFILHWGEMSARWGIGRTVAQIHALLYISPSPLHAEEICQRLSVARSNVSTSLRELQGWGVVRTVHVLGDRRDHFECMKDVWEMFRVIAEERKRREFDPTAALLRECLAETRALPGDEARHMTERLTAMQEFFNASSAFYDQLSALPIKKLVRLMSGGEKLKKALGKG